MCSSDLAPDASVRAAATNELGILAMTSDADPASVPTRIKSAGHWFAQAATQGSAEAIENLVVLFLFFGAHHSDAEIARALRALEAGVGRPGGTRRDGGGRRG